MADNNDQFDFIDVLIWLIVLAPVALMLWGMFVR